MEEMNSDSLQFIPIVYNFTPLRLPRPMYLVLALFINCMFFCDAHISLLT